jgi:hypothetical protein
MTTAHDRVSDMVTEWRALRLVLAELEAAEHPDVTDVQGRVWTWWKGDLFRHEGKAWPRDFIQEAER